MKRRQFIWIAISLVATGAFRMQTMIRNDHSPHSGNAQHVDATMNGKDVSQRGKALTATNTAVAGYTNDTTVMKYRSNSGAASAKDGKVFTPSCWPGYPAK